MTPASPQTDASAVPHAPPLSLGKWEEARAHVALFVPRVYRDAYRAFTSKAPIDAVLRLIAADPAATLVATPGAWSVHPENPLDAFGAGGTFDHWKVSRLYGSRRPMVARGPRGDHGIVEESWTLISPYPSADLDRLESGTLLIVLRVP